MSPDSPSDIINRCFHSGFCALSDRFPGSENGRTNFFELFLRFEFAFCRKGGILDSINSIMGY